MLNSYTYNYLEIIECLLCFKHHAKFFTDMMNPNITWTMSLPIWTIRARKEEGIFSFYCTRITMK